MDAFPGRGAFRNGLRYHITRGVLVFIRYRRSEDGKPVAKALVYTRTEHGIDRAKIDPDAIRIIEHLRNNGHEAYIVGGAVRDLLLGRTPKDFDLVTDAPADPDTANISELSGDRQTFSPRPRLRGIADLRSRDIQVHGQRNRGQ